MRKLDKVKFLKDHMFPVHVGYCNTKKAWERLMKYMRAETYPEFAESGRCDQFESTSGGLVVIISINHKTFAKAKKRQVYSVLAHEAKHAHDAIMDHIKEFKRDGECSAYTIDWLVIEGAKAFKI